MNNKEVEGRIRGMFGKNKIKELESKVMSLEAQLNKLQSIVGDVSARAVAETTCGPDLRLGMFQDPIKENRPGQYKIKDVLNNLIESGDLVISAPKNGLMCSMEKREK